MKKVLNPDYGEYVSLAQEEAWWIPAKDFRELWGKLVAEGWEVCPRTDGEISDRSRVWRQGSQHQVIVPRGFYDLKHKYDLGPNDNLWIWVYDKDPEIPVPENHPQVTPDGVKIRATMIDVSREAQEWLAQHPVCLGCGEPMIIEEVDTNDCELPWPRKDEDDPYDPWPGWGDWVETALGAENSIIGLECSAYSKAFDDDNYLEWQAQHSGCHHLRLRRHVVTTVSDRYVIMTLLDMSVAGTLDAWLQEKI